MKRTYRLVSIILLSLLRRLRLYRPGVLLRNRRCCSPVGVVKSKAYFNLKRYTAVEKKGRRQKAVYHLILHQKALQRIIDQSASRKSPKSEDNFLVYRFLASSQKKNVSGALYPLFYLNNVQSVLNTVRSMSNNPLRVCKCVTA